jgi:hypothetical protein
LKGTSTKVSNLATRLDVAKKTGMPVPPDLMGFVARNLGITKGLDANGSAAMVMLKLPEGDPGAGAPPVLLLLPTTDAAGLLEGFSPAAADAEGIQEVTAPQNGRKGYAAVVAGKWVACAAEKEVLSAYLKRTGGLDKGLSAPVTKAFESNDVVMWVNMEGVRPLAEIALAQAAQVVQMQMQAAAANRDAFGSALQQEIATLYLEGLSAVVRDSENVLVTLRMGDAGVTTGFAAAVKAGTPLEKLLTAQQATAAPTLEGLPGGAFLMAASMRVNGAALQDTVQSVVDRVLANPGVKEDPRAAAMQQMLTKAKETIGMIKGGKMVLAEPTDPSKGYLKGTMLMDVTDPAKYLEVSLSQYENPDALKAMTAMSPDMEMKQTLTRDAVTVQGVKFAKLQVTYKLREETPDKPLAPGAAQGAQILSAMYGPDGMVLHMGVVGNQVLAVIGGDEAMLGTAVAAAQAKSNELAAIPGIAAAKGEIVAYPVGVAYLPVGKWVGMVAKFAGRGGMPAVAAFEKAPPMVVSAGISGGMLTEELFAPVGVIGGIMDMSIGRSAQEPMPGGMP